MLHSAPVFVESWTWRVSFQNIFFFFFVTNGYQFLADKTTCIRSSAHFRFLFFFCNFYCFILLRDFAESSSRRKNTSQCVSRFLVILFQKRGGEGEKKKTIQEAIEFWSHHLPVICVSRPPKYLYRTFIVLSEQFFLRHPRDIPCLFSPLHLTFTLMKFA